MRRKTVWIMWGVVLAMVVPTVAQRIIAGHSGQVGLPYAAGTDSGGQQWLINHGGYLQQQGNQPVYSQGARLTVNGSNVNVRNQGASIDPDTHELVLAEMQAGVLQIERRIRVMDDGAYVRYIDVLRNPTGTDVAANLQIQTNTNYGVQSSRTVDDPRGKDGPIGWVAMTGINRAIVEVFAGQRSEIKPNINAPQGNNYVMAQLQVSVPKNGEIAVAHLHSTANTAEEGETWLLALKDRDIFQDIPTEMRRSIVNFRAQTFDVGKYEILRGEVFDVVELRSGDQFQGTLRQDAYRLTTFYGELELPVDRVVALLNVGQVRPRTLVVTRDGEVFGGILQSGSIDLELSSGQVIEIPLAQVSRVGYRKRADEPEEWTFDRPLVLMRQGDRVLVQAPDDPVEVVTRYGTLALRPQVIAAVAFQSEDHGVHDMYLRDGSRFAGLVTADAFAMQLADSAQVVNFPASSMMRLQMEPLPEAPDADSGILNVTNGDVLVGTLTSQLQLDTAFDTIQLNGPEIKRLSRDGQPGLVVQVTMWDNTRISGELQQDVLQLSLKSGIDLQVPISLLGTYDHPLPLPSAAVRQRIEAVVADLDADDWRLRDRAQAQLVSMGVPVVSVLRELRTNLTPESQQRIDQVIEELQKQRDERRSAAPMPHPVAGGVQVANVLFTDDPPFQWQQLLETGEIVPDGATLLIGGGRTLLIEEN